MNQEMYYDAEIFPVIKTELEKASNEILIVMAWFTDDELFSILEKKLDDGVEVGLVIADNQDNQKLPFNNLVSKGARLTRIETAGYGIMHNKFCVIDNSRFITGSYNWTINARKNNGENILLSEDASVIASLKKKYNDYVNGSYKMHEKQLPNTQPISFTQEEKKNDPFQGVKEDMSVLLDAFLSDLVKPFDQNDLKKKGFDRCQENTGDENVINGLLDSVYDGYLRDIDINETKKNSLTGKINDQKLRSTNLLNERFVNEQNVISKEQETLENSLKNSISTNETEIEKKQLEIKKIEDVTIKELNTEIKSFENEILAKRKEFVKPKHKLYELVPWIVITSALICYLILFYSSAAYILFYSELDAQIAEMQGVPIMPPEVFNGNALSLAYDKGVVPLMIILLFTVIPFSAALLEKFWEGSAKIKWAIFIFGIVVLDGFIAYKVASSIHNIDYIRGSVDEPWHYSMALGHVNFWIVFVLGSIGFLFFGMSYNRLINYFQERHPNAAEAKSELEIKSIEKQIEENRKQVGILNGQVIDINKEILDLKNMIILKKSELDQVPINFQARLSQIQTKLQSEIHSIESLANLYLIKVENEDVKIASEPLKHRVDCAMSGWSEWLYKEYSRSKAAAKLTSANQELKNWYSSKSIKLS